MNPRCSVSRMRWKTAALCLFVLVLFSAFSASLLAKPLELSTPPGSEAILPIRTAALLHLDETEKWPADIQALKRFTAAKGLPLDLSPFDRISLVSQSASELRVEYTTRPPDPFRGAFAISVSQFTVKQNGKSTGRRRGSESNLLAKRIDRFQQARRSHKASTARKSTAAPARRVAPFAFDFYCLPDNTVPAPLLRSGKLPELHRFLQDHGDSPESDRTERSWSVFAVLTGPDLAGAGLQLAPMASTAANQEGSGIRSFSFDMKSSMMAPQGNTGPTPAVYTLAENGILVSWLSDRFVFFGPQEKRYQATFRPAPGNARLARTQLGTYSSHSPRPDTASAVERLNAMNRRPGPQRRETAKVAAPIDSALVIRIQFGLRKHGYYSGPEDGKVNRSMMAAIDRFEKDYAAGRVADPSKEAVRRFKASGKKSAAAPASAAGASLPDRAWPNRVNRPADAAGAGGFSTFPRAQMYIVPLRATTAGKLPGSYAGLKRYIAARAISAMPKPMARDRYVIFVFLENPVSPTATFDIKVSKNRKGTGGYSKGVRVLNFSGKKVAYLPGSLTLFDSGKEAVLYVKAVFSPGEEVGFFSRYPRQVGLFCTAGR